MFIDPGWFKHANKLSLQLSKAPLDLLEWINDVQQCVNGTPGILACTEIFSDLGCEMHLIETSRSDRILAKYSLFYSAASYLHDEKIIGISSS